MLRIDDTGEKVIPMLQQCNLLLNFEFYVKPFVAGQHDSGEQCLDDSLLGGLDL